MISLASESSMRMCLDRLSKKELYGQCPVVTYPTKQALNQVIQLNSFILSTSIIGKPTFKLLYLES